MAHGVFSYRAEVDGLRAIAVVPVVLSHAGLEWFRGGYVGVDVFFVISGYLITSIILTEHEAGNYSIVRFYERRARRILPSLMAMLALCLPFAWAWMTPHHLKGFSQSLVAVSGFAANVYFFLKSGYFDLGADETPLLHTWSLGIEEQYYVGFPLLVMLCWKGGARVLMWVVVLTALVSIGASEWSSRPHPVGNFYLLPTRAWELAVGSLLAIAAQAKWHAMEVGRSTREMLAAAGLVMIIVPIFVYDHLTPFPGLYAIPPTLGAALVIACGLGDTWVGRLLSVRAMVGLGLISYSVYLWHQPLFAFARLQSTEKPATWVFVALSAASIGFGYLAWRFIEKPFRERGRFSRRQIFVASAVGSAAFLAMGLAGHFGEGFPSRFTSEQQAIMAYGDDPKTRTVSFPNDRCFLAPDKDSSQFGACVESPQGHDESVFLWGDSHAAHLYPGLVRQLGPERRLTHLTTSSCAPFIDERSRPSCQDVNRYVLERISRDRPDRVILAAVWGQYEWMQLERTVQRLKEMGVRRIDLVGPMPRWSPSLPVVLVRLRSDFAHLPLRTAIGLDPAVPKLDAQMREFAARQRIDYLSPYQALCDSKGCLIRVGDRIESMMQWDVSHLTRIGSEFLVARLWQTARDPA